MNHPGADRNDFSVDIAALQAIRQGRIHFVERLVDASADRSEPTLAALRSDATYQLAEFLFLLRGFEISTVNDLDGLIERHNTYASGLLQNAEKMRRMGLTKERVLAAIFDGETRPRILKLWLDEPRALDQSTLARLLVAVMSDETARKTIVACGKAGFLDRKMSVFRIMLVRSRGILEDIYGQCLREVRLKIQSAGEQG